MGRERRSVLAVALLYAVERHEVFNPAQSARAACGALFAVPRVFDDGVMKFLRHEGQTCMAERQTPRDPCVAVAA